MTGIYSGVDAISLANWPALQMRIKDEQLDEASHVVGPSLPMPPVSIKPESCSTAAPAAVGTGTDTACDRKPFPNHCNPLVKIERFDVNALTCQRCARTFCRRLFLQRHADVCNGQAAPRRTKKTKSLKKKKKKQFRCALCTYRTVQPWRIPCHMVREHPDEQRRHQPVRSTAVGIWYGC